MKKILFYFACLAITNSALANPYPKLLREFAQTFSGATNVRWNDYKEGYFVSFTSNGNLQRILYNKEGEFVCSWKYTNGAELPANIYFTIVKMYKDSKIMGVTEFATSQDCVYEIRLTTDKYWYSIKVTPNSEILQEKKYNNQ